MRPDLVLLGDLDEALAVASEFVAGRSKDDFVSDRQARSAVMYELIVVGEAAGRLSEELRAAHPEIEWRQIISFRNRATHAYFTVDWDIVFDIVTDDLPRLRAAMAPIIESSEDD